MLEYPIWQESPSLAFICANLLSCIHYSVPVAMPGDPAISPSDTLPQLLDIEFSSLEVFIPVGKADGLNPIPCRGKDAQMNA